MEISPGQDAIFTVLGDFVLSVLPAGTVVQQGQANRVPEPPQVNFVVMWPLSFPRLGTNVDSFLDVAFQATIAGATMTVTEVFAIPPGKSIGLGVDPKTIDVGDTVLGMGIAASTRVVAQVSGTPGGVGVYTVAPAQALGSRKLACGAQDIQQPADCVVQMDVHGPASLDNAQIISTLFRDAYAVNYFADHASGDSIVPLYNDDPRQMPFINGEQQYEDRYIVTVHMQVNQKIRVAQQFADQLDDLNLVAATSLPA